MHKLTDWVPNIWRHKQYACKLLVIICLCTCLPVQRVIAQTESLLSPAAPMACEDGVQTSGAAYRICMPGIWNGKLLIYAHGYVAPNKPLGIPQDQLTLPGGGGTIDQVANTLGYAFATTGYSTNGLAVQPGIADLVDLVTLFEAQKGVPKKVLLVGISEGGGITALAVERYPEIFDGGLALCGPYGSFVEQVDYFGDFRVLFDYFFPGLIPPTAVDVPTDLLDTWESSVYSTTIKPVITDPANANQVDQLLAVANTPFNAANAATKEQSISDVLWYNIYATNDAKAKLGGQPFANPLNKRTYSGSTNDTQLNATVQRFDADQAALDAISASYETNGSLSRPLVTMHTTGDPVVPYRQAELYASKVISTGSTALYDHIKVEAYGHCQFTSLDIFSAFNRLVTMVDNQLFVQAYLPLIIQ